jgi:hypothetical protein
MTAHSTAAQIFAFMRGFYSATTAAQAVYSGTANETPMRERAIEAK